MNTDGVMDLKEAIFQILLQALTLLKLRDENGCIAKDTIEIEAYDPIVMRPIILQPKCNGSSDGSILLNVFGGSNSPIPLKFIWNTSDMSQSIDNLEGGRGYSVTVTDGEGCKTDSTFFLENPDSLQVLGTSELVNCYGGSDGTATITGLAGGEQSNLQMVF